MSMVLSGRVEKPCQVEEHRRRETQRIDPVQDPAVPLDQRAIVLDAAVSLYRGHDEAAREPHEVSTKAMKAA